MDLNSDHTPTPYLKITCTLKLRKGGGVRGEGRPLVACSIRHVGQKPETAATAGMLTAKNRKNKFIESNSRDPCNQSYRSASVSCGPKSMLDFFPPKNSGSKKVEKNFGSVSKCGSGSRDFKSADPDLKPCL